MNKLGCFGVPSVFSPKASHCSSCKDVGKCKELVSERLRSFVGNESVDRTLAEFLVRHSEKLDKVSKVIESMVKKGVDTSLAKVGINPFSSYKRSFECAFSFLLEKRKVSRPCLVNHFMKEMGWAKTSAQSEVTIVWKVFERLEIVSQDEVWMSLLTNNTPSNSSR